MCMGLEGMLLPALMGVGGLMLGQKMGGGDSAPAAPPVQKTAPAPTQSEVETNPERTAEDALRKRQMAAGRRSTLLTGGQGLGGAAPTRKSTLLGGGG